MMPFLLCTFSAFTSMRVEGLRIVTEEEVFSCGELFIWDVKSLSSGLLKPPTLHTSISSSFWAADTMNEEYVLAFLPFP